MRDNLLQSGALGRAAAWFQVEVPRLGLSWEVIRGLFSRAWDALGPSDLLDPAGAWQRISGIFAGPLARLRDFAAAAGGKLLEFVFEGVLALGGPLGSQVMAIVSRAGGVLTQIVHDPIGFAGNLVAAVRGGLGQFLAHIGSHLQNGLFGWLTGALRSAVRLPARLDLPGIVSLALDLLGLTWDNLRGRLVRVLGERRVALLERGVDLVQRIVTGGLGAIAERIAGFASGIVDTVISGIRDWVANSVVGAAITRLIAMFNPAGAVISAILAVYNTVRFFIERAQQLGALANSVFDSIAVIAGGGIGSAVTAVEAALGRAVPVVLGFLARLLGIGDVATPVRNVMARVRGVIDGALDRVVGWLAGVARRLRWNAPAITKPGPVASNLRLGHLARSFQMLGKNHRLTVVRRGGRPVFEMASRRELLQTKIARAMSHDRVQSEPLIVAELVRVQALLSSHEQRRDDATWTSSREVQRATDRELEIETNDVAAALQRIGYVLDIDDLRESAYVLGGYVHPKYQSRIRATFYGRFIPDANVRYRRSELSRLMNLKLAQRAQLVSDPLFRRSDSYLCPGHDYQSPHLAVDKTRRGTLSLDHKDPDLVTHWNDKGGRGQSQDARLEFNSDTSNLHAMCRACNSKKKGLDKYRKDLLPGFTGPGEA